LVSLTSHFPLGAYYSFLGTFENLNKPYPAEFGLPYVVLASTTASSNWRIYQEKHSKFKKNAFFKSFFCFYYVKTITSRIWFLPFSNPCILWPLGKLTISYYKAQGLCFSNFRFKYICLSLLRAISSFLKKGDVRILTSKGHWLIQIFD